MQPPRTAFPSTSGETDTDIMSTKIQVIVRDVEPRQQNLSVVLAKPCLAAKKLKVLVQNDQVQVIVDLIAVPVIACLYHG